MLQYRGWWAVDVRGSCRISFIHHIHPLHLATYPFHSDLSFLYTESAESERLRYESCFVLLLSQPGRRPE